MSSLTSLSNLKIQIFADGADLDAIGKLASNPLIKGFTTNPSLLKKAGVTDYKKFAVEAAYIGRTCGLGFKSISFEVLADDLASMEREARIIASWGSNVYVKIPITNSVGVSTIPIIKSLSHSGVKVNVTAITTNDQVAETLFVVNPSEDAIISIFCGRIADTGVNPADYLAHFPTPLRTELLWASPRQLLDIFTAEDAGFHIITVTPDILSKLHLIGKDLSEYSLETVRMFLSDAQASGLTVNE